MGSNLRKRTHMNTRNTRANNNKVEISGTIASEFRYSHSVFGEKFYAIDVNVKRFSGVIDKIPVLVSERFANVRTFLTENREITGKYAHIYGQFRSFNKYEGERAHLILNLFAQEVHFDEDIAFDINIIELEGCICKETLYRRMSSGREISDILLAVNRPFGKTDYIPCICWGRNGRFAETLKIGTRLKVTGRIQSREYVKKLSKTERDTRIAYEVSIGRMEVVDEDYNT